MMKKYLIAVLILALFAGGMVGHADAPGDEAVDVTIEGAGEATTEVESPGLAETPENLSLEMDEGVLIDEAPDALDSGDTLDLSLPVADAEAVTEAGTDAEAGAEAGLASNEAATIGDYTYSFDSGIATITSYVGSATSIVLPGEVVYNGMTYKINQVGAGAFAGNTRLERVTLPASLMRLGDIAFKDCTGLRELVVNSDLADFSKYNAKPTLYQPDSDHSPFYNTGTNVDSFTVIFGDGVTRVPAYMFATARESTDPAYAHVTDVVIGPNVKRIEPYAFFRCHDLRSVSWGQSLVEIGGWTFAYNTRLQAIAIPAGTETLGERCFFGDKNLIDLSLPDSLQTIGVAAFEGCETLEKVVLPSGLKRVGDIAFKNCTRLSELVVNSDLAGFSEYNAKPTLYQSDSDHSPFYNTGTSASAFTVTFAHGVTRIPAYMFATGRASTSPEYCRVSTVYIPTTVTAIGAGAFCNCHALRTVVYAGSHYAWNAITVGQSNECLLNAAFTYEQPDPVFATGISLDQTTLALDKGKKATLIVTILPENTTDKGVIWATSNANVATVIDGLVTATGVGKATITVTSQSNPDLSAACKVTVSKATVAVKSVKLSKSKITVNTGRIFTLKATVSPSNATKKGIKWKSSNTKVAMVHKGTVYAVGKGTAVIRATSTSDGKKYATCKVTVKQANPGKRLTKVGPNGTVKMKKGKKLQLICAFAAKKGWTIKSFASSDKKVAAVSAGGLVTAKKPGTATITVVTENGKKAAVKIKVA